MFGKKYKLFNLMGFEVGVDASWIILAVLVAWSLSTGFFPYEVRYLSRTTYWIMGILGAAGLFLSIILHEFAHSVVARRNGIPMKGITLFIFGGVAQMTDEPPGPGEEFRMAVIGPVSSIVIGLIFWGIYYASRTIGVSPAIISAAGYLAYINFLLAVFNLIPAYPLDGGRILRSILWKVKGNLKWATRISSITGQAFGFFLIVLGIFRILYGNLIGGMWLFLIGMFLQSIAKTSYQQLLTRKALQGEPVKRFMKTDIISVTSDTTIESLVEDYLYRYHYKMLPVINSGLLKGCVTLSQVKSVPKEEWSAKTINDIITACSEENTVNQDSDAMDALSKMNANQASRLMVVNENQELVGIVALKDMLAFLAMKIELEDGVTR